MATITPYTKQGKTYYQFKVYLGINPLTGKPDRTTRRGFKTEKQAQLALARLKIEYEKKVCASRPTRPMKNIIKVGLSNIRGLYKKVRG